MKTVDSALNTVSAMPDRRPIARLTVRDTRLRFALANTTDPNSGHASPLDSQMAVRGDNVTLWSGNQILRVYESGGSVYAVTVNAVADTGWGVSTNIGAGDAKHNPGVIRMYDNSNCMVFYVDGGVLKYKTTATGSDWSAATSTGISIPGTPTLAPTRHEFGLIELYACTMGTHNEARIYRIYKDSTWHIEQSPINIYGDSEHAFVSTEHSTTSCFDAFYFNGKTHIIFCNGFRGKTYIATYKDGIYSWPQQLIADEYTKFVPYRATVIGSLVWLTGRLIRENAAGFSPSLDVYLTSRDGRLWTLPGHVESFLCSAENHGQIILAGTKAYYLGTNNYSAPATILIDAADPSGVKHSVPSDRILSANVSLPGHAQAISASIELATADNTYIDHTIVKERSEATLELGYLDNATERYVEMVTGVIDKPPLSMDVSQRSLGLQVRDRWFSRMKEESVFSLPLKSQLKHFDACNQPEGLYAIGGQAWSSKSSNLMANSGFEEATIPWTLFGGSYGTGGVDTTSPRTGTRAYKVTKTTGVASAQIGIQYQAMTVLKDKPYTVTVPIKIDNGATPAGFIVKVEVTGNFDEGGASKSVSTTIETSGSYLDAIVSFTALENAEATLKVYWSNCLQGTFYVDDVSWILNAVGYLSYSDFDGTGLLYSTDPVSANQFDINTTLSFDGTTFTTRGFGGLVGLGDDLGHNYVMLVMRPASNDIALIRVRNSVPQTELQTVAYTQAYNTSYDLRFVYSFGHFIGMVKKTSENAWAIKIDYTWIVDGDVPCVTKNGEGHVGITARVLPKRFLTYGVDEYAHAIGARQEDLGDFLSLGTSGEIMIDTERMTFSRRSADTTCYLGSGNIFNRSADLIDNAQWITDSMLYADGYHSRWNGIEELNFYRIYYNDHYLFVSSDPNWLSSNKQISSDFHANPDSPTRAVVLVNDPGGLDVLNAARDKVLVFQDSMNFGSSWWIWASVKHWSNYWGSFTGGEQNTYWMQYNTGWHPPAGDPISGMYTRSGLVCGGEGYSTYFNNPGTPNWVVYRNPVPEAIIVPGLFITQRGSGDTIPAAHSDQTYAYEFSDQIARFFSFQSCDMRDDYSTEGLIEAVCGMVGVPAEFHSTVSMAGPYAATSNPSVLSSAKNFDLEFDMTYPSSTGHVVSVLYRYQDASNYSTLEIRNTAGIIYARFVFRRAGQDVIRRYPLFDVPVNASSFHVRMIVNKEWRTVIINGKRVVTHYDEADIAYTGNALSFLNPNNTLTNIRIPEFYEWRDAIYVDCDQSAESTISTAIGERPIKFISRTSGVLFSSFATRDDPNTALNSGNAYSAIWSLQTGGDTTGVFTFAHVYADEIGEFIDEDLMRTYGFIYKAVRMPRMAIADAAVAILKVFREIKEQLKVFSGVQMRPNLLIEPEDTLKINRSTTMGAPYTVSDETMIINGVSYAYSEGRLDMSVDGRLYVS